MFGSGGVGGTGSFFGRAENVAGGSFFGAGPAAGEGGKSFFGSSGFGTPIKSFEQKPPTSFVPPDNFTTTATPAKKMKTDAPQASWSTPSPAVSVHKNPQSAPWSNPGPTIGSKQQPAASGSTVAAPWGGAAPTAPSGIRSAMVDDHLATPKGRDCKQKSTEFPQQTSNNQPPINPHGYNQQTSSTQLTTAPHAYTQPPPNTQGLTQQQGFGSAEAEPIPAYIGQFPAQIQEQQKLSEVQSSVQMEEKTNVAAPEVKTKDDASEDIPPADAILKELLNMQKEQLSELLPELREQDEKSEQILDSAGLVLKEITNYSEKLSGIKQQYCSRLSQVSSFLRMIPKTEQ